jgi:hypothetical protein
MVAGFALFYYGYTNRTLFYGKVEQNPISII